MMSNIPENSVIRVLYDEVRIAKRNDELAAAIKLRNFDNLLVVAVLKGSFMFAADLIRAMHRIGMSPQVEFIHLSSYKTGTVSTGKVEILRDIDSSVEGRDVVIVDDILESGRTLAFAKDLIMARGARTADICVLLEKPGKRAVHISAEYVGFVCPDLFVVGYGMDVAHACRQLPFVGVIERMTDKNQMEMM
jgi:hypoxanthine phosphoribosyltransferase